MQQFRPSRFEVLPLIVKNLLIINGLVLLAQYTLGKQGFAIDDWFALHAWQSPLFKPWQLLTHMFMHSTAGIGHILGNMFALWMFGSILENLWGAKRFLIFYLVCGLGAALLHLIFLHVELSILYKELNNAAQQASDVKTFSAALIHFFREHQFDAYLNDTAILNQLSNTPNSTLIANRLYELASEILALKRDTPTVGASGAVFGILAAFIYLFPNTYIYLYFFVPVKAKWLGLFYFAYELFYGIQNSAGDNVARWAHIGGALVGFLLVYTWNKTNKQTFY
jgi:membrane associated rhomboid family serine protease